MLSTPCRAVSAGKGITHCPSFMLKTWTQKLKQKQKYVPIGQRACVPGLEPASLDGSSKSGGGRDGGERSTSRSQRMITGVHQRVIWHEYDHGAGRPNYNLLRVGGGGKWGVHVGTGYGTPFRWFLRGDLSRGMGHEKVNTRYRILNFEEARGFDFFLLRSVRSIV